MPIFTVSLRSFHFFFLLSTVRAVTSSHLHLLHHPFFPVTNFTTSPAPAPLPSRAPQSHPQVQAQAQAQSQSQAQAQSQSQAQAQAQAQSQWQSQSQHPPQSQQQPFSFQVPSIQQYPFFPISTTPPPPPPPPRTALATFPANISSLVFPHGKSSPSSSSSSIRKRLFISLSISMSLLFSAILVGVSAFIIYSRNRGSWSKTTTEIASAPKRAKKGSEKVRLFPPNTLPSDSPPSDGRPPTIPHRPGVPSTSSSEFLYLGTLANPNTSDYQQKLSALTNNMGIVANAPSSVTSSFTTHKKFGSPDLRPLPPLPKLNYEPSYRSGEALINPMDNRHHWDYTEGNQKDEDDLFYSPGGSSGGKDSLTSPALVHIIARRNGGVNRSLSATSSQASDASANEVVVMEKSRDNCLKAATMGKSSVASSSASSPFSASLSQSLSCSPRTKEVRVSCSAEFSSPVNVHSPMCDGRPMNFSTQLDAAEEIRQAPTPPPSCPPLRLWEDLASSDNLVIDTMRMNEHFGNNVEVEGSDDATKPKLKPLHWDKVKATSDRTMAWDQIKYSSFQLNEEMIETFFMANDAMYAAKDMSGSRQCGPPTSEHHVLDPRKSRNIAILLRALNVTIDEVCGALVEGHCDTLGADFLENLKKMAPTIQEERNLKELNDESLGPAEKFLKAVLCIPFAFKRIDAMIYIANFDSEIEYLLNTFCTVEEACTELRQNRLFLKLLEAVLKTGNRLNSGTNRGDARAFRLDALLKLVDVKGTNGKTTLLHFVVQEIIISEGSQNFPNDLCANDDMRVRKHGLQMVSGLSGELSNVKKVAAMDWDVLDREVASLSQGLAVVKEVLKLNDDLTTEGSRKFSESMMVFLERARKDVTKVEIQGKAALSLVKGITEYMYGDCANEDGQPFKVFTVVKDFLVILGRVCKDVGKMNERSAYTGADASPALRDFSIN